MRISRTLIVPMFAAAAFAAAIAVLGCSGPDSDEPVAKRPRPVRMQTVAPYREAGAALFPGRVRADRRPALSFRVGGRITKLLVDVGDNVVKGAVLAELDASDFRTRLADATAEVARAEAEAARARRAADRAARLFKGNAVSEAERDQTRDLATAAVASLESARQRLALSKRELDYTRLVAPEGGVVVERLSDPAANVQAGQSILRVSASEIDIRTDVPESELTMTREGTKAEVRIPALGNRFLLATITRVARGAQDGSVLYPVFLRLTDPAPQLVPGMAAEVRFLGNVGEDSGLLAVPTTSVVADPDGPFVWVLTPGDDANLMTAHRRSVVLERLTSRAALISKGLKVGEKVATAGASYLYEGQIVRPARLPPLVFEGSLAPASAPRVQVYREGEAK